MSRKNLESLLDSMLEESATAMEAAIEREREEKARAEREREASTLRGRPVEARGAPALDAIAALAGLPDPELQKVLAKAAPDDLLIVLATSKDAMQRRILGNLGADAVRWLRANLAHIDEVTNAEREGAERKVLKVANALLRAGEIRLPEPESVGAPQGPDALDKDLRDLLTDLVRIASQSGPEALSELLASAGEPLLAHGLSLVVEGVAGDELRSALAKQRAKLEADHARRLTWMEDAIVAIAAGETPEAFRARLFEKA